MKRLALIACLAVLAAPTSPVLAQTPARKRVAVLDFDYATVRSYVADIWGSDQDIGRGIADMLVTQMVRNGTYSVIERKQLDRILHEQNFQQSGRADASTAAQVGRVLAAGGAFDMSSSNFGGTILGEATRLAVDSLVTELVGAAPKIQETVAAISGLVADVAGSELS